MTNKVIIINSEDERNNLKDGTINYIGKIGGDHLHSDLLIEYGINTYGNSSIFQILSDEYYMVEVPAFFLSKEYDNVVFLNIAKTENGKKGLLYLPDEITEKQIEALEQLGIEDFHIEANFNLNLNDGIIESDTDRDKGEVIISNLKNRMKKRKNYTN